MATVLKNSWTMTNGSGNMSYHATEWRDIRNETKEKAEQIARAQTTRLAFLVAILRQQQARRKQK